MHDIQTKHDEFFMRRALSLAKKGAGKTSPNPMVGAVIVRYGNGGTPPAIVGEGYHHGAGLPHAEVIALAYAGSKAKGAILYTNLEPCCHTEKRTPPCTNLVLKSGIARVVIAMKDPNPMVNGRGIKILRKAGITVTTDVLQNEAKQLNEVFVTYITTRRPFVILKAAMTLDGKIATKSGESRWITGEVARQEVHKVRSEVDAVLVGIGTVLADNPNLVVGKKGTKNPLRVVIDPYLKIQISANLIVSAQTAQTLVITTTAASAKKQKQLEQLGVKIEMFPLQKGGIPFKDILKRLGEMGITSLLIEGGGNVNGRALREGVVDKVIFYIAPKFLCGDDAKAVVAGKAISSLADAAFLHDVTIRKVGDDLCVCGYIGK
jgi:diaminohydroxyphosphoribosylaminopyrimidine deaminase/5-amino-6-(5-phosphoribosylamino)uracil reductase